MRSTLSSQQGNKQFFDPDFKSCAKFLATIAENRFGFDIAPVEEMVRWADIVDGASYESAEVAVGMKEPAMRITMAIEANQDPLFIPRLIELLAYRSLEEIVAMPLVAEQIPPLLERHQRSIEIIRKHSECMDQTIFFDVTDMTLRGTTSSSRTICIRRACIAWV